MKIKGIKVGVEETINIGNFESIRASVTLEADVDENDDLAMCHETLHKQASKMWARQVLTEMGWARQRRAGTDKEQELLKIMELVKPSLIKLVK